MPPKSILYVSPAVNIFGAERRLIELIDGLDRERYTPFVLAPGNGPLVDEFKKRDVAVFVYDFRFRPLRSNPLRFIRLTAFLINLLKTNNIGLVHFNLHYFAKNFWLAILLCRLPAVVHIRSPLWCHVFEKFIMSRLMKVLCVSQAVKNAFLQKRRSDSFIRFAPGQVEVVYDGHDLNKFAKIRSGGKFRNEFGISEKERLVALIGAVDPVKGQDLLIQAAAAVSQKYPDVTYLIIGELYKTTDDKKEYFDRLKALAGQSGLNGKVIFTGYRHDIPEIIHDFDIIVQPSEHEALGGCMIEGMAAGKPVIGTNVHGTPEIIGDNEVGIVMPRRTAEDLAQAITFLLEHPEEARRKGEAGQARARRYFDMEKNNARIVAVYEEVIRSRKGVER